ncbi:MAG: hypothetical protein HY867_14340 [Chloroflexi bacterium]|nr:hypothetical protein [Chloroflexota bacterium]
MHTVNANPFQYGNPVLPDQYIAPNNALIKLIKMRIFARMNIAIVSEPRCGKTSLLYYLKSQPFVQEINTQERFHFFQYIDAHILFRNRGVNQSKFWMYTLSSIKSAVEKYPKSNIGKYYRECENDNFDIFSLEALFEQIAKDKGRLVLLIDEFDDLLFHHDLGSEEFLGGLRSLATRMESLVLVITSRLTVSELNKKEQFQIHSGSPYFNHFIEEHLGVFSDDAAKKLLSKGMKKFSESDIKFLLYITGKYPYFLQVAAHSLWNVYENNMPTRKKNEYVANQLYVAADPVLQDTWQHWSPIMRKAFVLVALDEMPQILGAREFDIDRLREALKEYSTELMRLEMGGFIVRTVKSKAMWRVSAQVTLWWLSDILFSALRENDDMGHFLNQHQLSGIFSHGERAQFAKAVAKIGELAKLGVETFIKSAAEGVAKGLTG